MAELEASPLADELGAPSLENQAERAVVEQLIGRAREQLTDRAGLRHSPPWEPKQEVRIGVLRPVIDYDAGDDTDEDEQPEDDAAGDDEPTPIQDLQALGVDFIVRPETSGQPLELNVDVDFAIYLPDNPTLQEAVRHHKQQEDDATQSGGEPASKGDAQAGQTPTPTTEGGEQNGGVKTKGQNVPLQVAWRRVDVEARDVKVVVPPTGEHATDGGVLAETIMPQIVEHFGRPEAARPFTGPRILPVKSLDDGSIYETEIAARTDHAWSPTADEKYAAELTVFAEPLENGDLLVSVSLVNPKHYAGKPFLDYTLYDCRFAAKVTAGGSLVAQQFTMAPEDYRYAELSEVPGHGRGCVAVSDAPNLIRTETLPIFAQPRVEPRSGHVPEPRWDTLASDPMSVLAGVRDGMRRERNDWMAWLEGQPQGVVEASRKELADFETETRRFELGLDALDRDPRLMRAFRLANQAFATLYASKPHINSWRLFQLVFIVSHLPALVAREHRERQEFVDELDHVDVLWFPTGGGKTEAYLGLIVTAALYDRMRGKTQGVTAWLKFPLRMLSVQQLIRVLRILVVAEQIRSDEGIPGSPLELGYLVGGSNTPNALRWSSRGSWWPGFDAAAKMEKAKLDPHRLVGQCPYCSSKGNVGLEVDEAQYRLKHICRACRQTLPIYMSDEEVYRYQPTVVVSTVDKVTGFAYYGEFTSFTHGPALLCPDHGYLTWGYCTAGKERCQHDRRSYKPVKAWKDPVPSLMIQDEMHLVREELGAFEAHFEGLIAELQRSGPSGMPSKILAATATIEKFHDQLRQVYGRYPRRFPSPGFGHGRSFYSATTPDTRRLFLGVMPTGGGVSKVEVAGAIQRGLLRAVHDLQNNLPEARQIVASVGATMADDELRNLLFLYELSLGFVNSKAHGAMIRDEFGGLNADLNHANEDQVTTRVLTSEVPVPELAEVIDLVEDADLSTPRSQRLRAIVGTSVVSHGVDLERLNTMVMAGLPPTTADYIQATSRSGRTHVGLVVTVFDHFSKREASTFTNFLSTHRLLDRLVEPVPVNKYAKNAVVRTLPALVVALLWDLARDPRFSAPNEGIRLTKHFSKWWNAQAAQLDGPLLDRLKASYRSQVAHLNPDGLENALVEAAEDRWVNKERGRMLQFDEDRLVLLFAERVLQSLRDIDEPVEFGAMPNSAHLYEAMVG